MIETVRLGIPPDPSGWGVGWGEDVFYDSARARLYVYVTSWVVVLRRCGNCLVFDLDHKGANVCYLKWALRSFVNPGWFGCKFHQYDWARVRRSM